MLLTLGRGLAPTASGLRLPRVFDFTGGALPAGAMLTRASTGTYFDSSGVMQTAAIDEPRFDHLYDGTDWVAAGLLIEPERTNRETRSAIASNWGNEGLTISDNVEVAPNGALEAELSIPTTASSGHRHRKNQSSTAGVTTTISFYAKPAGYSVVYFETAANLGDGVVVYDMPSKSFAGVHQIAAHGFENAESWSRFWAAKAATGTGTGDVRAPGIRDTFPGSNNFAGDGTSGVHFWGFQVEDGEFPTSLIPTNGVAETRASDLLTLAIANGTHDLEAETPNGFFTASGVAVAGGSYAFGWTDFAGAEQETRLKGLKIL